MIGSRSRCAPKQRDRFRFCFTLRKHVCLVQGHCHTGNCERVQVFLPRSVISHAHFGVSIPSSSCFLSKQHVQEEQMSCALSCKPALDIMRRHLNEVYEPLWSSLCCKGLSIGCNGTRSGAAARAYLCRLSPVSNRLFSLLIFICFSENSCSLSPWQYRYQPISV